MVLSPLNSGATTFMSNIAPHPPDTSVTSINWAWGNLFLRMDIIFCSACLPASTPLGPFHNRDSKDIPRKLDVNTRWNIAGWDAVVLRRAFILLPRDFVSWRIFFRRGYSKKSTESVAGRLEPNLHVTPPTRTRMLGWVDADVADQLISHECYHTNGNWLQVSSADISHVGITMEIIGSFCLNNNTI